MTSQPVSLVTLSRIKAAGSPVQAADPHPDGGGTGGPVAVIPETTRSDALSSNRLNDLSKGFQALDLFFFGEAAHRLAEVIFPIHQEQKTSQEVDSHPVGKDP